MPPLLPNDWGPTVSVHVALLVLGLLPDVHGEHDDLGGHGGHLVAEAVLVHTVHVGSKRVLAVGLPVALVDHLSVRAIDLKVKGDYLTDLASVTGYYH